ncbi:ATP-binding protein [Runella sp.]|uniref:HAMP domain-containing sensor histidine kinase n=1 Tax=Runella sp. TaxID=1960881 RepID=UPI003D11A98E
MKIQTRIAIQFSLIVGSLLAVFSFVIYQLFAEFREQEYYERLKSKAITTAHLLIKVDEIDRDLLKIIDKNTLTALVDEKVLVFDQHNKLFYSSLDDHVIHYGNELLNRVRKEKYVETSDDENEAVGLLYELNGQHYVILASAYDQFGRSKMANLRDILYTGLVFGILITVLLGVFFAGNALGPVNQFISQISSITANNLRERLDERKEKDEIGKLAAAFNKMMYRLEQSFELQRSFVSHASHELRTPLAALKSEVEISLDEKLTVAQHRGILQNIRKDVDRLIFLSNSLLQIVRPLKSSINSAAEVRIDDVIFQAQDELLLSKPDYRISVEYAQEPDNEKHISVFGDEPLLKTVFANLISNACKYSPNHQALIVIDFNETHTLVSIVDEGIGIPSEDLNVIFEPFYRSKNALAISGFGVGLSVCKRIVELHKGKIHVESRLQQGSKFTIELPNIS